MTFRPIDIYRAFLCIQVRLLSVRGNKCFTYPPHNVIHKFENTFSDEWFYFKYGLFRELK